MNKSTIAFLIGIAITASLALIVLASISAGSLWSLIGGVIVLGVIAITLSWIGVTLFGRLTESRYKMRSLQYDHVEKAMRLGYQHVHAGYVLLPAPRTVEYDIPVSIAGVSPQELIEYRDDAQNLVALSRQLIARGDVKRSDQIAPYHKARSSDFFRDVQIWTRAVQYLLANQMAKEGKDGERHLGTFCIAGTVDQLYERLCRD